MSMSVLIYLVFTKFLLINCTSKSRISQINPLSLDVAQLSSRLLHGKKNLKTETGHVPKKQDRAEIEKLRLLQSNAIIHRSGVNSQNTNMAANGNTKVYKKLEIMEYDENSSGFLEFPVEFPETNHMVDNKKYLTVKQIEQNTEKSIAATSKNITSLSNETYQSSKLPPEITTLSNTDGKKVSEKMNASIVTLIDILRSSIKHLSSPISSQNTSSNVLPFSSSDATSESTIKQGAPHNLLLTILRNDNNINENGNKTCIKNDGYEFDPTIWQNLGNRVLCGYDKNTGESEQGKIEDLGNGCFIRGDRLECGYVSGPYNDRENNPEYKNVAPNYKRRQEINGNQKPSGIQPEAVQSSTKGISNNANGQIPQQMCVEKGDRIVCYNFESTR